mgnify:CR=1 FL=1
MAVAGVARELGRGDGQHRAQPLAARVDQVVRELRDHLDIGHRLVENDAVHGSHVLGDKLEDGLQAVGRLARLVQGDDDSQGWHLLLVVTHSI